jgi:hypothetical protein
MIEKLLGHEVQYDIPEYHGDNKKCLDRCYRSYCITIKQLRYGIVCN